LIKSLDMASSVIKNEVIKDQLKEEIKYIEEGKTLSQSIRDIKIFPSIVDSMIKVGEETGSLDEMLFKTAIFYSKEVNSSLDKLTKLIEPVLMIIIGFIIGFIVISLVLPMFDIMYIV